jgi:hypothetical protein
MTVRLFLGGTLLGMIVCWAIWALIVMWLDPLQAGPMGFALFFLSLFLAVAATAALVGYGVRRLLHARQLSAYSVRPALRQGVFIALFLDLLLFLQLLRLMQWWIVLIILIFFLSLEFVFVGYDRSNRTAHQ